MNWCRIAGNSNLRCFVNIRALIAVLHFSSLYPGAFVSMAVERKDTFLLSQLVCLDRFSGIKAFLCYFLFIFIKRNTREERQCIIKAPTTTQIEITWPYNQIKKFHNEGILIVLPYIIAVSKDSGLWGGLSLQDHLLFFLQNPVHPNQTRKIPPSSTYFWHIKAVFSVSLFHFTLC